ncbi:S8 family serine peptidase, partial [Streptomyces sp. JWR5-1]|uniref:S8 family serine peptidase n=1 Tax=Streptomyces sp. JWR5-1 TaxID=3122053 RepID=UPI00301917B0
AAGNFNTNAANFNPANCNNVITVAASDREGNRAAYSNYGSIIDVTAPGGETTSTSANGIWSTLNTGTRSVGSE